MADQNLELGKGIHHAFIDERGHGKRFFQRLGYGVPHVIFPEALGMREAVGMDVTGNVE